MSDVQSIAGGIAAFVSIGALALMTDRARHTLRSTGQHRATTAAPDMTPLADLIAAGELDSNDTAWCPECDRSTFHAIHADGSRTCWTCHTDSPAGA